MNSTKSKTAVITGANSGIGYETALKLARQNYTVLMICRSQQKANEAKNEIINETGNHQIKIYLAELSDFEQVKQVADEISKDCQQIDILVNNAGIIMGKERKLNDQGVEYTLAINHLSHFILSLKLQPLLAKSEDPKVINLSSEAHKYADPVFDNWSLDGIYTGIKAYAISKLYNALFTRHWIETFPKIPAYSVHPGGVATNFASHEKSFFNRLFRFATPLLRSPGKGAETSIYLATTANDQLENGKYYKDKKVAKPHDMAYNATFAEELWNQSKKQVTDFI